MHGLASLEAIIMMATLMGFMAVMIGSLTTMVSATDQIQLKGEILKQDVNYFSEQDANALGVNSTLSGWYLEHNGH